MPRFHRNCSIAATAGAIFVSITSGGVNAASWDSVPSAGDSITIESLGPSTLISGVDGAWVRYSPQMSVDCSPPRGCYATTQRIHYDFSCAGRYAIVTERMSMDLNGTIVKHEVLAGGASYAPAYDAGATQILQTFCPLPDRG